MSAARLHRTADRHRHRARRQTFHDLCLRANEIVADLERQGIAARATDDNRWVFVDPPAAGPLVARRIALVALITLVALLAASAVLAVVVGAALG